jgi:hypothetical protein
MVGNLATSADCPDVLLVFSCVLRKHPKRSLTRQIRNNKKGLGRTAKPFLLMFLLLGFRSSRGGTRTPDPVINSHLLYQLSYSGLSAAKT